MKIVNLEILKVKMWFGDKDLCFVNLLNKKRLFYRNNKFSQ